MKQKKIPIIIFESNAPRIEKSAPNNVVPFPSRKIAGESIQEATSYQWKLSEGIEEKASVTVVSSGFGLMKKSTSASSTMSMAA